MKSKHFILAVPLLIAALALAGCPFEEFDDGYQPGDISHMTVRELVQLEAYRQKYCDATENVTIRDAALTAIRAKFPFVPEDGICGDFWDDLFGRITNKSDPDEEPEKPPAEPSADNPEMDVGSVKDVGWVTTE